MSSDDDPFSAILEQSSIHHILQAARQEASLQAPTRPFTPLHDRSLFQYEISSRPSSAYSIPKLIRRPTAERFGPIAEIKENEPYLLKQQGVDVLTLDDDGNSIDPMSEGEESNPHSSYASRETITSISRDTKLSRKEARKAQELREEEEKSEGGGGEDQDKRIMEPIGPREKRKGSRRRYLGTPPVDDQEENSEPPNRPIVPLPPSRVADAAANFSGGRVEKMRPLPPMSSNASSASVVSSNNEDGGDEAAAERAAGDVLKRRKRDLRKIEREAAHKVHGGTITAHGNNSISRLIEELDNARTGGGADEDEEGKEDAKAAEESDARSVVSESGSEILVPVKSRPSAPTPEKSEWRHAFDEMCGALLAFSSGDEEPYWELAPKVEAMVEDVFERSDGTSEILLRAVLGLLEASDAKVFFRYVNVALKLLMLDKAIAQVSASGIQSAFLNIMKALFKFSKIEGNDAHFISLLPLLFRLLKPRSTMTQADDKEALIFLIGALKNASLTSNEVQRAITDLGAIPSFLALCGKDNDHVGNTREAQVLIQVIGALRNLTSTSTHAKQFLEHDGFEALTRIAVLYSNQKELLLNIARVLSKLSLQPAIVEYIQQSDKSIVYIRQVSRILQLHGEYAAVCVRLMFFLGNITAKSERARILFMFECDGAALMPQLLNKYWKMDRQLAIPRATESVQPAAAEVEDALTKIIRVIANLAMSPSVGATAAATSALVEPLLDIMGCKKIQLNEELVLNAVGCATNLLYYDVPSNLLYLPENKELLCRLFRPFLLEAYNSEAVMEAARALGNLSRHASTRLHIRDLRIDEILGILLEHDDRNIVYYTCGVLVNLASDLNCTHKLVTCGVPVKLTTLMEEISWGDTDANVCVLKVFTNLLMDDTIEWDPDLLERLGTLLTDRMTKENNTSNESVEDQDAEDQDAEEDEKTSVLKKEKMEALHRLAENFLQKLPSPRYACPADECGRKFDNRDALENHVHRRHADFLES